jgi:hypothetical protein
VSAGGTAEDAGRGVATGTRAVRATATLVISTRAAAGRTAGRATGVVMGTAWRGRALRFGVAFFARAAGRRADFAALTDRADFVDLADLAAFAPFRARARFARVFARVRALTLPRADLADLPRRALLRFLAAMCVPQLSVVLLRTRDFTPSACGCQPARPDSSARVAFGTMMSQMSCSSL